jgi:hypothetical protein
MNPALSAALHLRIVGEVTMDRVHILWYRGMTVPVQLPSLSIRTTLECLRWSITRRRGGITTWCWIRPVVADTAQAEGSLGNTTLDAVAACMLRYAVDMPDLGRAGLLRMECGCQGIDLALELGDPAIGLLLSLPGWRSSDASEGQ